MITDKEGIGPIGVKEFVEKHVIATPEQWHEVEGARARRDWDGRRDAVEQRPPPGGAGYRYYRGPRLDAPSTRDRDQHRARCARAERE